MSRISRKKLARGTKLYPEHVAGPLSQAATALSGNVSPDQMESAKSTFRVNLHIPYVDSSFWSNTSPDGICYSVPFVLPPFQEDMNITTGVPRSIPNDYSYRPTSPRFYLDEISFGFDQRDESCIIADRFFDSTALVNAVFDGKMNFGDIEKLNVRLALFEHRMTHWDVDEGLPSTKSDHENIDGEVWGVKVPNIAYAGKDHRFNPVLVDGIDVELSPHTTYVFAIYAPDLSDAAGYALSSITASLKIRTDLVRRDTSISDGVQNIPTKHGGDKTNATVSVTTPAAGSVVTADQAGGISQNLAVIDDVFRDKLNAGYTDNSETVPNQNLLLDSGYEIIAVPMFQGRRYQVVTSSKMGTEPYFDVGAAIGSQFIADRRIVPIHHPFVIHHVMLAYNWQETRYTDSSGGPPTIFVVPESAGFTVDVGVAIATGLESDGHTYEQVAQTTIAGPDYKNNVATTWFDTCVDRVRSFGLQTHLSHIQSTNVPAGNPYWWDWEMHQVPLVGLGGVGYVPQGKPFFVGKGWSPTWGRTQVGNPPALPSTSGSEQFIEVRMRMSDTVKALDAAPTLAAAETLYSGYQGHWVYLIGKKTVI